MRLTPIIFAWLSLLVALVYVDNHGWHDTTYERAGDWYYGYAESLTQGQYHDCIPKADSYHCETPLPDTAFRLPGYPAFLTGVMVVTPDHAVEVAKALQAVLVAMVTFITVHLAYHLREGRFPLVVGVLMLGAPSLYYNAPLVQTETLFTFIVAVFTYAFLCRRWTWAGVLWGLSLMVRTSLLFSSPLLLLLMPRRKVAVFVVSCVLVVLPMMARNVLVLDAFKPFGTNGGTVLKAGHNDESYRTGEHVNPAAQADWATVASMDEVQRDNALTKSAIEYAKHQSLSAHLNAIYQKVRLSLGGVGVVVMLVWGMVGLVEIIYGNKKPEAVRRAVIRGTHQRGGVFRSRSV